MGRQRVASPGETRQSPAEEEVAALVAAILAGSIVVPNPALAIAEALLNLIPSFLPSLIKVRISADIARLVVQDQPTPTNGTGANLAASESNLAYRALYAVSAVKRLVKAARGPSEESVEDRLTKALQAERSYLEGHLSASKRRTQQAAVLDAMAKAHGPILSWNHRDIGKTHRPSHLRADGSNFDIREVPRSTEAFPGFLPGCHCFPGPPLPGARNLS
jgi:hypothetical protein